MQTVVLQELKPYTKAELQAKLYLDELDLMTILEKLSIKNIVKSLGDNVDELTIEDLLDDEVFDSFELRTMYVFKFVGIISVKNLCILIYPKYLDSFYEDRGYVKFKQVVEVIRKYNRKNIKQGFHESVDTDNFNLLAITLELLEQYYEHNLYSNDKVIIESNGEGEILWDKTINETTAYFFNQEPIYVDLYTMNTINNEDDFFRRLHASVITEACEISRDVLNIIGINGEHLSNTATSAYGTTEYLVQRINQEISQQFVTYKQKVLGLIKSYIGKSDYSTASDNISFVGTTSFHYVWEDVCSVVMGDCVNKSLAEMGLTYSQSKGNSTLVSEIIPKPQWIYVDDHGKEYIHEAQKTLIPDLVVIDNDKRELSIYDAKYYKMKLNERIVAKQPGVGDVDKQYLYALAYRKFADENRLIIKNNAFLMPTETYNELKIGKARMPIFHNLGDFKFDDIEIILKPCEEMYNEYLRK